MIRIVDILKKVDDSKDQKEPEKLPVEASSDVIRNTIKTLAEVLTSRPEKRKESDNALIISLFGKVIDKLLSGEKELIKYCDISNEAAKNICQAVKEAILACRIGIDAGYDKKRLTALFAGIIIYKIESFPTTEKNKFDLLYFKQLMMKSGFDVTDKNFEKIIKSIEIFHLGVL